jgi:hypothetical protein
MIKNGTDVNTALRQADEKLNKAIATAKAAGMTRRFGR